jgi:hypothetical protein
VHGFEQIQCKVVQSEIGAFLDEFIISFCFCDPHNTHKSVHFKDKSARRFQIYFLELEPPGFQQTSFHIDLGQPASWVWQEVEKVGNRKDEIGHLGYKEQQGCFAEGSQNCDNSHS